MQPRLQLTSFTEEVGGMWQLSLLQLQLTLLDQLQQLIMPEDGELWADPGPLPQNPALQLHVAVWNQLAHHRLALDLCGGRADVEMRAGSKRTGKEDRKVRCAVCVLSP